MNLSDLQKQGWIRPFKRHRVIYDVSGCVSKQEAKSAFDFAIHFVETVEKFLQKK